MGAPADLDTSRDLTTTAQRDVTEVKIQGRSVRACSYTSGRENHSHAPTSISCHGEKSAYL